MSIAVKTCIGAVCALGLSATLALGPSAGAATPDTRLILGGVGYEVAEMFPAIAALPQVTRYVTQNLETGAGFFPGTTPVLIDYPAWIFHPGTVNEHVAIGADRLGSAIEQTTEPLAIVGHSEGSMVLDTTRARLESDPTAPAADQLQFVLFGSPMRGLLTTLFREGARIPVVDITVSAPVESRYDTSVVTHEYDFWADFPDRPWNLVSLLNAGFGMAFAHARADDFPEEIPPQNITTVINSKGATDTAYFVPTPTLPLTEVLRIAGVPDRTVDALDSAIRPIVDAGYSRNDKPGDPRPYLDHGVITTQAISAGPASGRESRAVTASPAVAPTRAVPPAAAEHTRPTLTSTREKTHGRPGPSGHRQGAKAGRNGGGGGI